MNYKTKSCFRKHGRSGNEINHFYNESTYFHHNENPRVPGNILLTNYLCIVYAVFFGY